MNSTLPIFGTSDYLLLAVYGIQGIGIFFANGLLLLAILLEQSFRERKEMLIIGGMASTDFIYGIGVFFMAVYRAVILWRGEQNDRITVWECIILPPLFLLEIGLQLTAVMNIVLSSDRLMAVAWPVKYRQLDKSYANKILALIALFGVLSLVLLLVSTYFGTSSVPIMTKMCSLPPFSRPYNLYQTTLNTSAGYASVIIYICVFVAYQRTKHQISSHNDEQSVARERRLTVTLGIINISTLLFIVIPDTIFFVCTYINVPPPQTTILGIINRFSTINNVVIYVVRQKEMRREMWMILTCKMMNTATVSTTRLTIAAH